MLISPLLCNNYRKQVLPVLVKANIFYHMIVRNIYIIVFTPEYAQHGTWYRDIHYIFLILIVFMFMFFFLIKIILIKWSLENNVKIVVRNISVRNVVILLWSENETLNKQTYNYNIIIQLLTIIITVDYHLNIWKLEYVLCISKYVKMTSCIVLYWFCGDVKCTNYNTINNKGLRSEVV